MSDETRIGDFSRTLRYDRIGTIHTGNVLLPETRATKAANRRRELARHAGVPAVVLTLEALREASASGESFD